MKCLVFETLAILFAGSIAQNINTTSPSPWIMTTAPLSCDSTSNDNDCNTGGMTGMCCAMITPQTRTAPVTAWTSGIVSY